MTPECERLGLLARPIELRSDVEVLRLIRNACKDGFSHDNEEISPQQQEAWWTLMREKVRGWLYWVGGEIVGYGLLRQTDDERWWSSVAVLPDCMGKGYGGALTADLVRRVPHVVWATARLDNPAALKLHRPEDWFELNRDDRLVYFQTRPHVYLPEALMSWQVVGGP